MSKIIEDKRNEFKIKLTEKLEEEVIAFLNTDGGNIFIGVNDARDDIKLVFKKSQKFFKKYQVSESKSGVQNFENLLSRTWFSNQ